MTGQVQFKVEVQVQFCSFSFYISLSNTYVTKIFLKVLTFILTIINGQMINVNCPECYCENVGLCHIEMYEVNDRVWLGH